MRGLFARVDCGDFDGLRRWLPAPCSSSVYALFCEAAQGENSGYSNRDGFAVWAKRLEEGTYAMPFEEGDQPRREITAQELGALLSGIDLSTAKRRKRYRRGSAEAA